MIRKLKWDPCVYHRGLDAQKFCVQFFGTKGRKILLIAAAGFDHRSCVVAETLTSSGSGNVQAIFLREHRENPDPALVMAAEKNLAVLQKRIPESKVEFCQIFASDGAVIGGRAAIGILRNVDLTAFSDIVIDLSALSVGVSFPIVRFVLETTKKYKGPVNVHAVVQDAPPADRAIRVIPSERESPIQSFQGKLNIDETSSATRLWVPQLIEGKRDIFDRMFRYIQPNDVCPVLPFPSKEPRRTDVLIEHFAEEFESTWEVDARNVLYADEGNPLDLYRTILRIDDARSPVFAEVGGSIVVLSPLGSKAMALGCLMAAIERDFPAVYVEAAGYTVDANWMSSPTIEQTELVHVWLSGEAYPD